jgi:hypothetical protein
MQAVHRLAFFQRRMVPGELKKSTRNVRDECLGGFPEGSTSSCFRISGSSLIATFVLVRLRFAGSAADAGAGASADAGAGASACG